MVRAVSSTSAARRLEAAHQFLASRLPASDVTLVGASRGAVDDFARAVARTTGATFGLTRFSLTELAARAAAIHLAGARRVPGSQAGAEAVAARAVFDAIAARELEYFGPVASMPGFPKALARTLHELRLAGVEPDRLIGAVKGADWQRANADIGRLLGRVEEQQDEASVDDRASLFRLAADACRTGAVPWAEAPLLFLDVPIDSLAERAFVAALVARAPDVLATIPDGDHGARAAFVELGASLDELPESPGDSPAASDLVTLRHYIFSKERPPQRELLGDVRLFSAPGEGREAVEIVRRVLDEAARGVPFDEMAVFLRTPQQYLGLLEHACARGGVPAYFDRGTERPDPAGRAFIALVTCAVDGLSAKRFDEYLSLAQVPVVDSRQSSVDSREPVRADDEVLSASVESEPDAGASDVEHADAVAPPDSDDEAVIAGTLRSPWKWEELIVESAVVGGRTRADGAERWRGRLRGLANDFRYRLQELRREEPESPRVAAIERDLRNLEHLRAFALPIVDELAAWPDQTTWGEWLALFEALAARALARPVRVLQVLADLRPMAAIGPVTLEEARDVLHDRLVSLDRRPPARRYGRLFVGTPHQARGRSVRVAFVPGLAERVVPQRPREDPLLLDERRRALEPSLVGQEERGAAERLLLKIAIGAARERLYLSYPRLDVAETRARVPSFYALDVIRAMTGRVPDHRVLASDAAAEGGASLAWPAPKDPDRAIDDLEHDLAVLKPLLDSHDVAEVKGRAHYLLGLNAALRRSVISRWERGRSAWSKSDGVVQVSPQTREVLDRNRLGKRPYSLSALQRFAACPYQFLLSTIHRLQPWEEPEPIVRMDPLTKGSLFHETQAHFFRELAEAGGLPIGVDEVPAALVTLNRVLDRVAARYADDLVPAIARVWNDEIEELRRDLGIWVRRIAGGEGWKPEYFEFGFGLHDEGRDERSLADPVAVDGRFLLHGSVDLIEIDRARDVLRVTDHKTGKNRSNPDLIVGGGATLQPVLYSMVVEQGLGKRVESARLFYATTAGGFAEHTVAISEATRNQGRQVLAIIDRAVEMGMLPAAPQERACTWCDFRPVCGPREEERTARKAQDRLADLLALRSMR